MARAGELDTPVEILRSVDTQDDQSGRVSIEWIVEAQVFGRVRDVKAETEQLLDDVEAVNNQRRDVTIRYRSAFGPKLRIRFEGLEWEVEGVRPVGRRELLVVRCRARLEDYETP